MSAKYLYSLADENPDMQKQIGCMTGVFHVFNRQHMVSGRRLIGYSPKRGGSGGLIFNDRTPERESSVTSHMEQHRISTESSKDSFSSWSPSSPFSYMDCNTDKRPPEELRGSRHTNRQNIDLRDVVKDSMYREARGLSHKTTMKKEAPNDVAAKLRETNWYCDEPRELSRSKSCQYKDGLPFTISKDYPRFSFDGRESDRLSTAKTPPPKQLKEPPRLSLDSKEQSIRTLNSVSIVPIKSSDFKSRLPSGNPRIDGDKDLIQTRPPSLVAKLMGLETFPDSESTINKDLGLGPIKRDLMEGLNPLSKSLKASDDCGSARMTNSMREPTSPGWKNLDMKPISRVPIEAAPWKQRDARVTTSSTKIHSPPASVYGEVGKRVKNLEFSQSGKDLRALKQILEAMHAVEAKKSTERSSDHEMSPSASKRSDVSTAHESHIVIMKPAQLSAKGSINNKTGKDPIAEITGGERRSRLSLPLSDSNKPRNESNKKQSESRSSNGRRRPSNVQKINGGRSLKTDTEVNASEHSEETSSRQSPSSTPEKSTLLVKVSEPLTPEYPSPVSVLDDSVYMDNSPSPVKHTPSPQKDDGTQNPAEEIVKDRYEATNNIISKKIITGVSSPFNCDKLKKVADLVQKLKKFNSDHDEAQTDYIASLCDNTNPNDRYISEIFLASGLLLRDLESFEFHSSGHPINPALYLVLEHTKFKNLQKRKFHRKLIFDAVNEILMRKLSSASKMMQTPRKLLRELCLEMQQLEMPKSAMCGLGDEVDYLKSILWEDVMKKSENWTVFHDDSPAIAVEVERLIFRDLVNEVVWSEACDGKLGKPGK